MHAPRTIRGSLFQSGRRLFGRFTSKLALRRDRRCALVRAALESVEPRRLLAANLSSQIPSSIVPGSVAQELFAPGVNGNTLSVNTNSTVFNSSFRFVLNNGEPTQTTTFTSSYSSGQINNIDSAIAIYDASGNRIALQDTDTNPALATESLTAQLQSGVAYVVRFAAMRNNGGGNTNFTIVVDTGEQKLGTPLVINPATTTGTLATSASPNSFTSSNSVRYIPVDFLNGTGASLGISGLGPDSSVAAALFIKSGSSWIKQSTATMNVGGSATLLPNAPTNQNVTDGEYLLALAPLNFTAAAQPVNLSASIFSPLAPPTVNPASAAAIAPALTTSSTLAGTVSGGIIGSQVLHTVTASVTGPMTLTFSETTTATPTLTVYNAAGSTMVEQASRTDNGIPVSLTFNAVAGTQYAVLGSINAGVIGAPYTMTTTQTIGTSTDVSVTSTLGQLTNLAIAPAAGGKLFRLTTEVGSKFVALQIAPDAGSTLVPRLELFGSSGVVQTFTSAGAGQPVFALIDVTSNAGPYTVFVSSASGTGTATMKHTTLAIPASVSLASLTQSTLNLASGGITSAVLPTDNGTPTGIQYYQPVNGANPAPTTFSAISSGGTIAVLLHYVQDGASLRLLESATPTGGTASVTVPVQSQVIHGVVALPVNFGGAGGVQMTVAGPLPTGIGLDMVPNALPNQPAPPAGFQSTMSVAGARLSSNQQRDLFQTTLPFNLTSSSTTLTYTPAQLGGPLRATVSVLNASNVVVANATSNAGAAVSIPLSGLTPGQLLRIEVKPVNGVNLGSGEYGFSMTVNTTDPRPFLVTQTEFHPFNSAAVGAHFPNAAFIPINFGSTGGSATGNFTSSTPYNNNGTGSIQVFEIDLATSNVPWQVTTTAIDPGVNTNFAVFYFNSTLNKYTRVPGTAPSFDYFPADRSQVDARIVANNLDVAPIFFEGEFGGPVKIYVVVMNEGGSRGQYRVTAEPAPIVNVGPGNSTPANILVAAPRAGSTNLGTALTTVQTLNATTFTLKTPSDMNGSNAVTSTLRVQTRDFSVGQTISVNISRGILFAGSASGVVGAGGVVNIQLDNNSGGLLTPILGPNQTYQVTVTASSMPSLGLALSLTVPYITPSGTVPPSSISTAPFPRDALFDSTLQRIMPSPTGALNETLATSGGAFYRIFTLDKSGTMNFTINSTSGGSPAVGLYRAGKTPTSGNHQDVSILMDFDNTRTSNNFVIGAVLPAGTYWLRGQGFDNIAPVTITGALPSYPARVLSVQPGTGITSQAEQTVINRNALGDTSGVTNNGFTSGRFLSSFFNLTVPSNATGAPVTFTLLDRLSTFPGQVNPVPPVGTASMEVWRFQNNVYTKVNSVLNLVTAANHGATISANEPAVPGTQYYVGVHFNGFQYASYAGFDVPVFTSGVADFSVTPIRLSPAQGQTLVEGSIVNGSFTSAPASNYTLQLGSVTSTRSLPSLAPFGQLVVAAPWQPNAASDVVAINANPISNIPELSRLNNFQSVALSTVDSTAPSVTIQLLDTNMTAEGTAGPTTGGTTWGRYVAGVPGQTSTIRLVGSDPNADLFVVVATLRNANGTFAINRFDSASGSSFTSNIPIDFGSLQGTTATNQNKISFYAMDTFGLRTPILIQNLDVATVPSMLSGGFPAPGVSGAGGTVTFTRSTRQFKYEFKNNIITINPTVSELLGFSVPFIGDKKNELLVAVSGVGTSGLNPNIDIPLPLTGHIKLVAVDKEMYKKDVPGNYQNGALSFTSQVTLSGRSLVPGSASATMVLKDLQLLNINTPQVPLFKFGVPGIAELNAGIKFGLSAKLNAAAKLGFDPLAGDVGGYLGSLGVMSPTFIQPEITGTATISGSAEVLGFDVASISGTLGLTITATFGLDNNVPGRIISFGDSLDHTGLKISGELKFNVKAEVLWYDVYEYNETIPLGDLVNTIDQGIFLTDPPSFSPGKFIGPGALLSRVREGGATPTIKNGSSLVGAYNINPSPQLVINNSVLNGIAHTIQLTNVGTAGAPLANLAFTKRTGGAWSGLTTISQTTDVSDPKLALTNDGANTPAVVVYNVDKAVGSPATRTVNQRLTNQEIRYRYYDGTNWGSEVVLTNDSGLDSQHSVAFNSSGVGTLAWVHNTSATPVDANGAFAATSNEIKVATWNSATHSWGAPVTLTTGGGSDSMPTTFVDASGKQHVVWVNTNGGVSQLMFATNTGGVWTAPAVLGVGGLQPGGIFRDVAMGSDGSGRVNVVFSYQSENADGSLSTGLYQRPATTATFTSNLPAVQITQNANYTGLRTTNTPTGALVAYWQQSDGQQNQIFEATISNGVVAGPSQISTSNNVAQSPSAAVDGDGKIQLLYNDATLFGSTANAAPTDPTVGSPTASGVASSSAAMLPQFTFVEPLNFGADNNGIAAVGAPIVGRAKIANRGLATAGVTITARNGPVGGGTIVSVRTIQLAPGATYDYSETFTAGAGDQTYSLSMFNIQQAFNTTENVSTATLRGLTDIQAVSLTNDVSSPAPGSNQTLFATVRNNGSTVAPNFTATLYAGDPNSPQFPLTVVSSQVVTGLAANSNRLLSFPVTLGANAGDNIFTVVVDPGEAIEESSELNNRARYEVNFRADPSVSSLDGSPPVLATLLNNSNANNVQVDVKVTNLGVTPMSNVPVDLTVTRDGGVVESLGQIIIPSLLINSTVVVTFTITAKAGDNVFSASINPAVFTQDSNLGNNTGTATLRVAGLAALSATGTLTSSSGSAGAPLTLNANIINGGLADAPSVPYVVFASLASGGPSVIIGSGSTSVAALSSAAAAISLNTAGLAPGNYNITLRLDPNETLIEDTVADNTLTIAYTISSQVVLGGPVYYLKRDADGVTLDVWANSTGTGSPDQTFLLANVSTLTVTAASGSQSLTIDFSAGNPLPLTGLAFNAPIGGTNSLKIIGTGGVDRFDMAGNTIRVVTAATDVNVTRTNVQQVSFRGIANTDVINLSYASGNPLPGKLQLESGSFQLNGFQNFNNTTLDMGTSSLLISYPAGNSVASTIRQYLQRGYNGGAWNGAATPTLGSINSSSAGGTTLRAVGYADFNDGRDVNLTPNTVLLKYTHVADTDLNGAVDFVDLLRLAQAYNQTNAVWDQGDLTYDGIVNFNDLLILAQGYGQTMLNSVRSVTTAKRDIGAKFGDSVIRDLDERNAFVARSRSK